jgi:hypothetical protein
LCTAHQQRNDRYSPLQRRLDLNPHKVLRIIQSFSSFLVTRINPAIDDAVETLHSLTFRPIVFEVCSKAGSDHIVN